MPTFTKRERLKSRKTIGQLFKGGNSFVAYPLRVVWLESAPPPTPPPNGMDDVATSQNALHLSFPKPPEEVVRMELASDVQVAISVPKKNFKTAVARNRIKRLVREAYRLHKNELVEKLSGRHIALMMMYIGKEELPYSEIEAGMKKMIRKFPV